MLDVSTFGRCAITALVIASAACSQRREKPAGTSTVAEPFSGPTMKAPFVADANVTIDGALDEPIWATASRTGPFVGARSGAPTPGPLQGEARVFWDSRYLYVAIDVSDADIRGGFPPKAVDPHLWERDTAEIMIDPDGADNRDYYELQINPQGLVFDSQFDDYNLPKGGPAGPFGHQEWSSKVEQVVVPRGTLDDPSDQDDGYLIEARIPWASFDKAKRSPPQAGDTWKMNFYAMQDNGGLAWSPILGPLNFHGVKYFGDVTFNQ